MKKRTRYITIPLEEYEALVKENELLKMRDKGILPGIDEVVFLSPRLYMLLQRQGIVNLGDLAKTKATQWTGMPGLGKKSWEELKSLMKAFGLTFAQE